MERRPGIGSLLVNGLYERIQYPALLAILAVFWLALSGFFNSTKFGFPYLFWHAEAEISICAGLALGVFLGEWCFVNFLLDSDRHWLRRWVETRSDRQVLMRYLFATNLLFASAFLPTPFFYRVSGDLAQFNLVRASMSALAIVTGVTVYVALVNVLTMWVRSDTRAMISIRRATEWSLRMIQRGWWAMSDRDGSESDAPEIGDERNDADSEADSVPTMAMIWVHTVSGAFFTLWVVLLVAAGIAYTIVDEYSRWLDAVLSPAVLVCVLLILLVRVYGFLVYHVHRVYFAVVAVVVFLAAAVGFYDWFGHKYRLPGIDDATPQFASTQEVLELQYRRVRATEAGDLEDTDSLALEAWMERVSAEGDDPILVVVAASGGGIRAQIWTTTVLAGLERLRPSMPYRTRLVTGASGGMVGAAYYVGTLAPPHGEATHTQAGKERQPEDLVEVASRDSLTATARTLFFRDLPRQFVPFVGGHDRGETLQRTWIRNSGGRASALNRTMDDLENGEQAGWCPSLVFTPVMLEDGRRLFVSNLNLARLTSARLPRATLVPDVATDNASLSVSAIEGALIEERCGLKFDLATAARLNATFPLISPAVAMPVEGAQWSLADASYYDNYGMNVAVRWLDTHAETLKEWRRTGRLKGILIVQIVSSDEPRNSSTDALPSWSDGWLTPLAGLFLHGMQKIVFTSDEQLESLVDALALDDPAQDDEFVRLETLAFRGEASLSWYLTPEEIDSLVYPFKRIDGRGQLDLENFGSSEYLSLLSRAGPPTPRMIEYRDAIQRQLDDLGRWWDTRSGRPVDLRMPGR